MSNPPPYSNGRTAGTGGFLVLVRDKPQRYRPAVSRKTPSHGGRNRVADILVGLLGGLIIMNFGKITAILIALNINVFIVFSYLVVRPVILLHDYFFGYRLYDTLALLVQRIFQQA